MSVKFMIASRLSHRKYLDRSMPCSISTFQYPGRKTYPQATAETTPTRSSHPYARSWSRLGIPRHSAARGMIMTVCTCDTMCIDLGTRRISNKSVHKVNMYVPVISESFPGTTESRWEPPPTHHWGEHLMHE